MRLNAFASFGLVAALLPGTVLSQDSEALVSFQMLSPDAALKLARAALQDCRDRGFQVSVSVVDRMGTPQVMLRDRLAGAHSPETARRKAWTAASFRTATVDMVEVTQAGTSQSGVRFVEQALMVGGGVPVEAAGSMVAAVGVSGAPSGAEDDACARTGIEAIIDDLEF